VLVMVMLIGILGLIVLMLVGGEMGKRMPASSSTPAAPAGSAT
jgi:hypothetical protein